MTNPPILPVLLHYGFEDRRWGYGDWQTVKCPFHPDTHASARLNETEGVFRCLACSIGGNAIKLVQAHEGVTYEDAKRRVEGITGVSSNQIQLGTSGRLASSKLPAWTRNNPGSRRRLSSRSGRRDHS